MSSHDDTTTKKDNEKANTNNDNNDTTDLDAAELFSPKLIQPRPNRNNSNELEILVGVTCFRSKTQIPFVVKHIMGQQHMDKVDDPKMGASYQMKLMLSISALCTKKIMAAYPFLKCSVHTASTCTRPAVDLIMSDHYCCWPNRDIFIPVMSPSCGQATCVHTGRPFARKMSLKAAKMAALGKRQDDLTQRRCEACGLVESVGDPKGKLVRCSQCKLVSYCSRKCQKADWKVHKALCGKPLLSKSTSNQSTNWFCQPVKQKLLEFKQHEAELNRRKQELRAYVPLIDSLFAQAPEETEEMRQLKEILSEVL